MQTVLIVEDDEDISRALTLRLRGAGFEVQHAFDAVLAMDAVKKWQPDVVLMDFSVPGGTGVDIAKRMRADPDSSGIPVIFLTASKRPDVRAQIDEIGMACFEKPYDPHELMTYVRSLLGPDEATV